MTKKCADLSKTELGTNCLTEIILLSQSRVVFLLSINKSLTCILISAQRALSLTGLSYMYIQTKTPPQKKKISVKEVSLLKLSGCFLYQESFSHFPQSKHL